MKYDSEDNRAWLRARIDQGGLRREINLKAILRAPQCVIDSEFERMILVDFPEAGWKING